MGDAALQGRGPGGALPVTHLPSDRPEEQPRAGIALCLWGGGYRAMLFHLGALWRLNELGYLHRPDRNSSVSGGSVKAGVLGMTRTAFRAKGDRQFVPSVRSSPMCQ